MSKQKAIEGPVAWMALLNGYMVIDKEGIKYYFKYSDGMLEDLTESLGDTKRCVGRQDWYLTQHSLLVAHLVSYVISYGIGHWFESVKNTKGHQRTVIKGWAHDLHEAYINDIPSPVGRQCFGIKELKREFQLSIEKELGIDPANKDEYEVIEYCDKLAWALESERFTDMSWALSQGMKTDSLKRLLEAEEDFAGICAYGRQYISHLRQADHKLLFRTMYTNWRDKCVQSSPA